MKLKKSFASKSNALASSAANKFKSVHVQSAGLEAIADYMYNFPNNLMGDIRRILVLY